MYRKCQILKKYVEMICASKSEEEVFETVVKIVFDAAHSAEIQNAVFAYVNESPDLLRRLHKKLNKIQN